MAMQINASDVFVKQSDVSYQVPSVDDAYSPKAMMRSHRFFAKSAEREYSKGTLTDLVEKRREHFREALLLCSQAEGVASALDKLGDKSLRRDVG